MQKDFISLKINSHMKRSLNLLCCLLSCISFTACSRSAQDALKPEDTKIKDAPNRPLSSKMGSDGYFQQLASRDGSFLPNGGLSDQKKYGGLYGPEDVQSVVYFEFDNSALSDKARETLSHMAEQLLKSPTLKLLIAGHCDWYGTEDYNLKLGERRAKSIERYLENLGISSSRMETVSMGSTHATPGLEKDAAWKDRRGDLVVIGKR